MWTKEAKTGYAVMTLEGAVQPKALPPGTSAWKAKLIAFMRALELLHEKRVSPGWCGSVD